MNPDLFWRIPSYLDIEKLIEEDRPAFLGRKRSNLDNFYYFIDHLLDRTLNDDLSKSNGYIQICSADLQQNMAHNYKGYLDFLKKHNIIEQARQKYKKGDPSKGIKGICFSFRLKFPYQDRLYIKRVPIIGEVYKRERKVLIKNLAKSQRQNFKKYPIFTKWFENLEIDVEGCEEWIDSHPDYKLRYGALKGYGIAMPRPQLKRLKALYSIEKINRRDFNFTFDDNVGRFHSNLTNLKSELRNFLTWEGQNLVSVDVKNSQPLLSLIIFEPVWYMESSGGRLRLSQFKSINNPLISPSKPNGSIESIHLESSINFFDYIMLEEFSQNTEFQDIIKYKEIVNSGEFYQRMHQEIFQGTRPFNKARIKEMTFQVLYSDNRFFHQDGSWMDPKTKRRPNAEPKRLFEEAFPTVAKVFRAYKKGSNSNLPRLLQQIESTLIIKHIVPRIASERPDLPIFTIHDSVVTTEGNEAYVERIMREEIERLTGLNPKFGVEKWSPENLGLNVS
jgi:hypothetical protein